MAKAQPKETVVDPEVIVAALVDTPVDPVVDVPAPEVTPEAPVAVEVLQEGAKAGTSYIMANGTTVTNY